MVDWASRNRLYPPGYQLVDIRHRRASIDSSLPYSVALNKRHNCRSQAQQSRDFTHENSFIEHLQRGLQPSIHFYNDASSSSQQDRNPKLIASYISNISWPRSICCLLNTDGSLVICEEERCCLLLFTSKLILRSTCGGKRGNGQYEFDSPWSVANLVDNSSSSVVVADTNNKRIQFFAIDYNGQFQYVSTISTKEKPYYIATSQRYIAVSCEKQILSTYSTNKRTLIANINLNRISSAQISSDTAFCLCMDPETSFMFISHPLASSNVIHQMTVSGEYLRCIKFDSKPFLRISSLTYDPQHEQILVADAMNSMIYSIQYDLDEDNLEILLKRSDNVNYPQCMCISNEGHLIVVECSVLTQHALKVFRYHPCVCHSRLVASSVKTSETTSVRSIIY